MLKRILRAALGLAAIAGADFLTRLCLTPRPENQRQGKFPEQLAFVRSSDDVANGGAIFTPLKEAAKLVAIVWIHGWGENFYLPSYVGIGRVLAERGFTTISANTRMHDLGNFAKHDCGRRVRGGGYWGITSQDARDIAAWIGFAQNRGFDQVILVGHSAGYNLLRIPGRSFPSFISAATRLDMVDTPPEYKDFFGTRVPDPAVARVSCPLLAFYGARDDIGAETELGLLKSSIERLASGPSRVDATMIQNGNREYVGEEAQVAPTIAVWAGTILPGASAGAPLIGSARS